MRSPGRDWRRHLSGGVGAFCVAGRCGNRRRDAQPKMRVGGERRKGACVPDPVEFLAIIPTAGYGIKFSGDEGARITLDVDGMSEANMLPLLAMRGQVLRVRIETEGK